MSLVSGNIEYLPGRFIFSQLFRDPMSTEKLVVGATGRLQNCPVCSDKLSCGSVEIDSPCCEMSPVVLHKVLELLDGRAIIRLIDHPIDDSPRNSPAWLLLWGRSLPL
jgi:hypothetical protein